jgi:3-oxoacyl-(acyl-carrier-protein) synthase
MVRRSVAEAVDMAGPSSGVTGVFVGTTGGFFVDAEVDLHHARQRDPRAMPAFGQRGPGEVAEAVAEQLGATGPVLTWSMACTSSAAALAAAGAHLRAGTCDRAVVVGFDPLSSLTVHGFRSLMLVDPNPCRPFDRTRAGLSPGEGAGTLVLERGPGRFELLGAANTIDTSNLTASATDGSTVAAVIDQALASSGLQPGDIVSIKAHGTGTVDNDLAEGRGLARVFGQPPPFASLKGALGHTLGAAGCLEVVLWLAALEAGFLPSSVGFSEPDPDIGVAPCAGGPAPRGAHLFNAFGFGGSCVALVVRDG